MSEQEFTPMSGAAKVLHRLLLRSKHRLEPYNVVLREEFTRDLHADKVAMNIFANEVGDNDKKRVEECIMIATNELLNAYKIELTEDYIILL